MGMDKNNAFLAKNATHFFRGDWANQLLRKSFNFFGYADLAMNVQRFCLLKKLICINLQAKKQQE
jgi:hypothetical protein